MSPSATASGVEIEYVVGRALRILKRHSAMTASQFATALWAELPGVSTNELLEELCRKGLVEVKLRTVGPVRYGLTISGLETVGG